MKKHSVALGNITARIHMITEDMMAMLRLSQTKTLSVAEGHSLQHNLVVFCALNDEKARLERLSSTFTIKPWKQGKETNEEEEPCWVNKTLQVVLPAEEKDSLSGEQTESSGTEQEQGETTVKCSKRKRKRKQERKWHLCVPLDSGFHAAPSPPVSCSTSTVTATSFSQTATEAEREDEGDDEKEASDDPASSKRSRTTNASTTAASTTAARPKCMTLDFLLN
ncbi:hypothetical protein QOT17_024001 [Balamuthia mandrillaris]